MKNLLALLALLVASPALAQNLQCPDRPAADSSNACANTRFVKSNPTAPGGTSGQVQYNNSGAFGGFTIGSGLPVVGSAGSPGLVAGAKTGNTNTFATSTGAFTTNNCVKVDASGNLVDAGTTCATNTVPNNSVGANQIVGPANTAIIDLKAKLGIAPSIADYGCVSGGADCTAIINAAIINVYARGINKLYIPPGNWNFAGEIIMDYPVELFGQDSSSSVLQPSHTGACIRATGLYGTGGAIHDLNCFTSAASTACVYLPTSASSLAAADFLRIYNIVCTGSGTYAYALLLDGDGRGQSTSTNTITSVNPGLVSVGGAPWTNNQFVSSRGAWVAHGMTSGTIAVITSNTNNTVFMASSSGFLFGETLQIESQLHGLRDLLINNIITFQSSFRTIQCKQCRGVYITNVLANGSNNGADFTSTTADLPAFGNYLYGWNGGPVTISNTANFIVDGSPTSMTIASDASYGRVSVTIPSGSISNSGTNVTIN